MDYQGSTQPRRFPTWMLALACTLIAVDASAALFASKETKEYKAFRAAARRAEAQHEYSLARSNYLAAHAVLKPKGFKSIYFKDSLMDLASVFARHGQESRGEPYLLELRDYYVQRRRTNSTDAAHAYLFLGGVQRRLHKFTEAEDSLKRAEYAARWKIGKFSVTAGYARPALGRLYVRMKRDQEAIELLDAALKQMGTFRRNTYYVSKVGSLGREERDFSYRPDTEDVAEVLLEYSVALAALGRDEEARAARERALGLFLKADSAADAAMHVFHRFANIFEVRREVARAEENYQNLAKMFWNDGGLTSKQKLKGNEIMMKFYVRQGLDRKANDQEDVLFGAGVSDKQLRAWTQEAEAERRLRAGGVKTK